MTRHTSFMEVTGAGSSMFSLLKCLGRSRVDPVDSSTLLLDELGAICTLWVPACRRGPGTAQTGSSDSGQMHNSD